MRINEILMEAPLPHDDELLQHFINVIDDANSDYVEFLNDNNDQDDIDHLAELLNFHNESDDGEPHHNVIFHVNHEPRQDPNEMISAQAGYDTKDGSYIDIVLHAQNLDGTWGPKTFKEILVNAFKHETIHFAQYKKIPKDKFKDIRSGHQKGQEKMAKTGNPRDWMQHYLEDPHELMAYGHDLANEILDTENPEQVLRNPESFIDELPTYARYRSIFDSNSKEMKQLLKYASEYFKKNK